jgi:hypothetical protein
MLRILDGIVFEGKPSETRHVVSLIDFGNGHRECTVQRPIEWREVEQPAALPSRVEEREETPAERKDRERANMLRAARRAKTASRRAIKAQGLDTLLTLTYRALEADLGACKGHFDRFIKRMRRLIPGFRYVAAFERQKRGAWHVHIATHRIPPTFERSGVRVKSFNVIRAVWRDVIKGDGNIEVARRSRMARKSPAKLAAYLSKYLLKEWDTVAPGTRRWQSSQFPEFVPTRVELVDATMAELIDLAYAFTADGLETEVCTSWLSRYGDVFFLAVGPALDRSIHCR